MSNPDPARAGDPPSRDDTRPVRVPTVAQAAARLLEAMTDEELSAVIRAAERLRDRRHAEREGTP